MVEYGNKEWGNMRCFGNPIIILVLSSIMFFIVYWKNYFSSVDVGMFDLITLKPYTLYVIILSLCSLSNVVCIKASTNTTRNILFYASIIYRYNQSSDIMFHTFINFIIHTLISFICIYIFTLISFVYTLIW